MGARDDMDADQVAFDGLDGLSAGIRRRFDRGNVADDYRRHQCVANLRHRAE